MGQNITWQPPGQNTLGHTWTHTHTQSILTRGSRESNEGGNKETEYSRRKKMQRIERGDDRTWGEIEIWVSGKMKEIKSDK